jgi:acyl-CoA synthetase
VQSSEPPVKNAVNNPMADQWRTLGLWPGTTLDRAFAATAAAFPTRALHIGSATRASVSTVAELHTDGVALAGALHHHGVRRGDVIAMQLPHWRESALLYRAAAALGAVIMPIVPIYAEAELDFLLRDSRAAILFVPGTWRGTDHAARLARLAPLPDLKAIVIVGDTATAPHIGWDTFAAHSTAMPAPDWQPDDPAFLVYTSGTTAAPKGVIHSSNSLLAEIAQAPRPADGGEKRTLSPYPAGHVAGSLAIFGHAISGDTTFIFDAWDAPAAARAIAEQRVIATSGTPFHYASLFDAADASGADLSSLTFCGTGGAGVPESLVARAEAIGVRLFRRYGMSEHPTVSQGRFDDPFTQRMQTDGHLLPGCEVRILDDDDADLPTGADGEIVTRGPDMFLGYTDASLNAAAFLPGGWFRSGDIGRLGADGTLTITDRKKDIIIRGGENLSARDIEEHLLSLPGVLEAAAVAMPDERLGEKVCAYVILRPGAALTLADIDTAFRQRGVARQKTPERLIIAADLPRTPAGKIMKAALRTQLKQAMTSPPPEQA